MTGIPNARPLLRTALAGAAAVLVVATTATVSTATPQPRERFHETWTETYAAGEDFQGCILDFPVSDSLDAWVNVTGVLRNGIWYYNGTFNETETITNLDNGKTFTRVARGSDRDQTITDNGDGTLTITVQATGPNTYYADGERLFIDTGMVRFSLLVDHNGTPEDPEDDEFLEFLGLDRLTGVRQTDGRDFCADLEEFIG